MADADKDSIALLPAREIAARVQQRSLSALDVFDAVVARIERYNGELNAIVRFDPAIGRAQAREADARAAAGETLPLLGVPFTVKDMLWTHGLKATQGSRLFENFVAPQDSCAITRLRAAGAVFVGTTNCSEFAAKGMTDNLLYGATCNPWDLSRTPGGSSGGSASAVAAGIGTFSLGTDAGGSIRRPAAHCGIVGFKPSHGIVADPHGFPDASMGLSVVGPMARTVDDAALVLQCIVGYAAADTLSIPLPQHGDIGREVLQEPQRSLRIAFSADLGCDFGCDTDVMQAIVAAVDALRHDGYSISHAHPAWPRDTATYEEMACEEAGLAALYGEALRSRQAEMDPVVAGLIERGSRRSGAEVAQALLQRRAIHAGIAHFFNDYDLLLCPTAPVTAWPINEGVPQAIGGRAAGLRGHAAFTPLFNIGGVPACSVPVGLVRGLPVGLQIVGPRFADGRVLQFARLVERMFALPACPLTGNPQKNSPQVLQAGLQTIPPGSSLKPALVQQPLMAGSQPPRCNRTGQDSKT
ncbi:MAG: gatA [Herminiimonas sp.]|nr:gatA [Herminiimonas sp.]